MDVGLGGKGYRTGGGQHARPAVYRARPPTPHPAPAGRRGAEQPGLCGPARPGLACWPCIRTAARSSLGGLPWLGQSSPGDEPVASLGTSHGLSAPRLCQRVRTRLRLLLLPPIHGFSAGGCSGWNGSCLVLVKSIRSCAATLTCRYKCYNVSGAYWARGGPASMRAPRSSDLGVSYVLTAPTLTLMMELHLSRSFLSLSTSSASLIVPTCTLPATDLAFTGALGASCGLASTVFGWSKNEITARSCLRRSGSPLHVSVVLRISPTALATSERDWRPWMCAQPAPPGVPARTMCGAQLAPPGSTPHWSCP